MGLRARKAAMLYGQIPGAHAHTRTMRRSARSGSRWSACLNQRRLVSYRMPKTYSAMMTMTGTPSNQSPIPFICVLLKVDIASGLNAIYVPG
jgi:hypothetical protein